jgi:hypothetical protein
LKDRYTQQETLLQLDGVYRHSFEVNEDPSSANENRFCLLQKKLMVLPVKEIYFDAAAQSDQANKINWHLSGVEKMTVLILERSDDGQHFETLFQKTDALNQTNISGNYLDKHHKYSTLFYRLKWIDFDGSIHYSKIKKVDSNKEKFEVYLNQINQQSSTAAFTIYSSSAKEVLINLFDGNGRLLSKSKIKVTKGRNIYDLQADVNIHSGIYRIEFQSNRVKFSFNIPFLR